MYNKWKIKIGDKVYKSSSTETVRNFLEKIKKNNKLPEEIPILRPGGQKWKDVSEFKEFKDIFSSRKKGFLPEEKESRERQEKGKPEEADSKARLKSSSRKSVGRSFDVNEVLMMAFEKIKERPLFYSAVMLISIPAGFILSFEFLLSIILVPLYLVGVLNVFIVTCRNGKASFSDLYKKSLLAINVIGLFLIKFSVIAIVLFATVYVFRNLVPALKIALIIIGLAFLYFYLRLVFTSLVIVDKEKGPLDAIVYSWEITKESEIKVLLMTVILPIFLVTSTLFIVFFLSQILPPVFLRYLWYLFMLLFMTPYILIYNIYVYIKLDNN